MALSQTKGALALLEDLISEMQANVDASGIANKPPEAAPHNGSAEGACEADGEKKKGEKKEKEMPKGAGRPVKVEPNVPPKDVETVNALDFRVGVIVSVKKHDTADKLYCEEIDIGEAEPRMIASGLVPHYTVEEMLGRRLIVVANLKPRNLVGFKSFGMVLCAATPDPSHPSGEKVEFVDPPAGAAPGDRVVGEGLTHYDALPASQVDKQKIWEKIGANLRVDAAGVATWAGVRLVVEGKEGDDALCVAPTVKDAPIR